MNSNIEEMENSDQSTGDEAEQLEMDEDELERLEQMRHALLAQLENENEGKDGEKQTANEGSSGNVQQQEKMGGLQASLLGDISSSSSSSSSEDEEDENGEAVEEEEEMAEESGWCSEEEQLERELIQAGNDQIDSLLEEPVDQQEGGGKAQGVRLKSKRFKRVLEFRGTDHFNVLPDGWVEITHSSGLPVYMHKKSRVCTFSRPYFIGGSSIRNHKVPESSIPCLFQKKHQEKMELALNGPNPGEDGMANNEATSSKLNSSGIEVKTEADFQRAQMTPDQLYEYAKDRFKFKQICILGFRKWNERRKYQKRKRMGQVLVGQHQQLQQQQQQSAERPGLSSGLKLITVPALEVDSKPNRRPFYLNPHGKTSVSILHEFVQKALRSIVRYFFSESRSSTTPYHCSVKLVLDNTTPLHGTNKKGRHVQRLSADMIRQKLAQLHEHSRQQRGQQQTLGNQQPMEMEFAGDSTENPNNFIPLGEAFGTGKKNAKLLAAKDALERLLPSSIQFDQDGIAITSTNANKCPMDNENSMMNESNSNDPSGGQLDASMASTSSAAALNTTGPTNSAQIFDLISVTDSRVPELCARAGQPSPYVILQEYLKRYSAFGDAQLQFNSRHIRHERHEFSLTLGEHVVRVVCRNKREGKQALAQLMLQKLHPKNETWGSILQLYGFEAQQKFRDARKNKDSVVKLQGVKEDPKTTAQFQPNALILDKLRTEMLKLSEQLVKKELCPADAAKHQMEPPQKLRRVDFQSETPILTEEELRKISGKFAKEHPQLERFLQNIQF